MPSERRGSGTASVSDTTRNAEVDSDTVDDTVADSDTVDRDTIQWGPVRHDRIRSLIVGFGLFVVLGVTAFGVLAAYSGVAAAASVSAGDVISLVAGVSPGDVFVTTVLVFALVLMTLPYLHLHYDEWRPDRDSGSTTETAATAESESATGSDPTAESGTEAGLIRRRLSGFVSLRPGWLLLGAVVPPSIWLLGVDWTALGVWPLVAWLWVVPFSLLWEGVDVELDPRAHAIRRSYRSGGRSRTDDLNAVVRTRRIDLPLAGTVFVLAYRGNEWYRSTPWLTVPRDLADAVETTLDDVLARSDGPDRASVPERVVLALIGSGTLVLGLALSAAGEGGAAVALGLLSAPFTLLFLALAARL